MKFVKEFTNFEIVDFLKKIDNEKSLGIMVHDDLLEYKYSSPKFKNGEKYNTIKISDYDGKNALEVNIFYKDYTFDVQYKKQDSKDVFECDLSTEWRLYVKEEMDRQEKSLAKEFTYIGKIIRNITGKTLPKEYDKSCKQFDKKEMLKQQEKAL